MTVRYMDSMVLVSAGLVSLFVVTVDLASSAVVLSTILAVVACCPVLQFVVVAVGHMLGLVVSSRMFRMHMAVACSVFEGVAVV